jgi:hypothetical protein
VGVVPVLQPDHFPALESVYRFTDASPDYSAVTTDRHRAVRSSARRSLDPANVRAASRRLLRHRLCEKPTARVAKRALYRPQDNMTDTMDARQMGETVDAPAMATR